MTSVAPAQNGAFMQIPTKTPRVHGLTTPTHARRRAGPRAPFGWGSTRQAKRRARHLGQTRELLAREHAHIGGRRQAGILIRQFLNDVHALSRHFYEDRLQGFQDEDSPVRRTCYMHSVSRLGR